MASVEDHKRLVKKIDQLLLARGERKGTWQVGTFSAKELLTSAEMHNTENNWRYVLHVMKTLYPDSSWERGSQDEGYQIRVRVRVK